MSKQGRGSKSGWLLKETKSLFGKVSWKKSWWILDESEKEFKEYSSDTSKTASLTVKGSLFSKITYSQEENGFDLLNPNGKVLFKFKAQNEDEREDWEGAFEEFFMDMSRKHLQNNPKLAAAGIVGTPKGGRPVSSSNHEYLDPTYGSSPTLRGNKHLKSPDIGSNSPKLKTVGSYSSMASQDSTNYNEELGLRARTASSRDVFDNVAFMGKARSFAHSISRETEKSVKRKGQSKAEPHRMSVVLFPHVEQSVNPAQFRKTPEQNQLILKAIQKEMDNFDGEHSFKEMDAQFLVDVMFSVDIKEGQVIFNQGEPTNGMYVIENGIIGVYTKDFVDTPPEFQITRSIGDSFGVLSLVYNQPAPFLIKAHTNCTLWSLTRKKYFDLSTDMNKRMIVRNMHLLQAAPMIADNLEKFEIAQLADFLELETFKKNDILVKKGQTVDTLYFIVDGSAKLISKTDGVPDATIENEDVYGEFALLRRDCISIHDVIAATNELIVMTLQISVLEEVVGPMRQHIIKKYQSSKRIQETTESKTSEVKSEETVVEEASIQARGRTIHQPSTIKRENSPILGGAIAAGRKTVIEEEGDENLDKAFIKVPPPQPNINFDRIKFLGKLGKGHFGTVHLCEDLEVKGQRYALKVLSGHFIVDGGWENMIENERDAMLELSTLQSPFLLKMFNYFSDNTNIYMVLEFCSGGNLFELMKSASDSRFSEKDARFYFACIILGIEAMHSKEIVYRDLKPENLLISGVNGYCKLADFGLAKKTLRTFTFCGTPDYMAPETLLNKGHGLAVDFWASGILLYEMISAVTPFCGFEAMTIYENTLAHENVDDLQFPNHIPFTPIAKDLIKNLLHPKKNKRLGMIYPGISALKEHAFFTNFDWEAISTEKMLPPMLPLISIQSSDSYQPQLFDNPADKSGWTLQF